MPKIIIDQPTFYFEEFDDNNPDHHHIRNTRNPKKDWINASCMICEGKAMTHSAHRCLNNDDTKAKTCINYSAPWKQNHEHPGVILAEELDARNLTVESFADYVHLPVSQIKDIISGIICINVSMALRFEHFFGIGAGFWMKLQTAYDFNEARKGLSEHISKFPTWNDISK